MATDDLRSLTRRLRELRNDLMDGDADVEYSRTQLAHRTVIDAMDEFRTNWDDNREYVADKLGTLADLAEQTADGFDETDRELAREITDVMEEQ